MLRPKKRQRDSGLRLSLCDNGKSKALSNQKKHRVVIEDIISSHSRGLAINTTRDNKTLDQTITPPRKKIRQSSPETTKVQSMPGFRPENKRMICKGKRMRCTKNTLSTKSSKISPRASILNEKDSRGFWTKSKKAISKKLWWPTGTAWRVLEQNSLNGSSIKQAPLSSFSTIQNLAPNRNSLKTSWPLYMSSLAGSMEKEDIQPLGQMERKTRNKQYQGLSKKQKAELKATLDSKRKEDPTVKRLRKYLLKPNQAQRQVLEWWMKDCHYTYNVALAYVKENKLIQQFQRNKVMVKPNWNEIKKDLRQRFVYATAPVFKSERNRQHVLRTPKEMRDQAVISVITLLKQTFTNLQKKLAVEKKYPNSRLGQRKWKIWPRFKSKQPFSSKSSVLEFSSRSVKLCESKKTIDIFRVWDQTNPFKRVKIQCKYHGLKPKTNIKKIKALYTMRGIPIKTNGSLKAKNLTSYLKIQYIMGQFYLLVPIDVNVNNRTGNTKERVQKADKMCAIDPGIRKFLTTYSPQGRSEILGGNCREILDRLGRRIDRTRQRLKFIKNIVTCESKEASRKQKKKFRHWLCKAKRRYHNAEQKAKNVVRDLHYKAAHFLLRSYKIIFYPNFNARAIAQSRKLNSKTKRRLNMLSFYKFSQRLIQTATFYKDAVIKRGSEAYTSKQCGHCGTINDDLGSNKTFYCKKCRRSADRDVHAARNILLKHLE